MREDFTSTEESTSQKYNRLVVNNPTRKLVDKLTQNIISEKLAKKDLNELHDIVQDMEEQTQD